MTSKLPLIAGALALALAVCYTILTGTIGQVQRYGTATDNVATEVTTLNTVRDTLVAKLTSTYGARVTNKQAYAYNAENYRYGTASCTNTTDGQYFTITNLMSTSKLPKNATYAVARQLTNGANYRVSVTTAGNGNVAQVVIRNPSGQATATLLAIVPAGSNSIVVSGSTSACLPLDSLPKTTPANLVGTNS